MAIILTDNEIAELIHEEKFCTEDYKSLFPIKTKKRHIEQQLEIKKNDGGLFKIITRQSKINPLDFSVILGYLPPKANHLFRIKRFNGKHEHTNRIEKEKFCDFHIHRAT